MKEQFANRSKSTCALCAAGVNESKPKHYAEDTEERRERGESEECLSAGEEFVLRGIQRDDREAALADQRRIGK